MRNPSALFLGFVSLLFAAPASHGQTFTPQSIHFNGAGDYSDAELADAAGVKIEQGYTSAELNRHAQQLLDTGLFEKIAYKFDGAKLTYTVKMSTQALPIQVTNLPIAVGKDLDDRLRSQVPLYRGTVPPAGSLLEDVRRQFEEMLAAESVRAHVAAELIEDPATHTAAAVRFSIDSNQVKIGSLKLEGVSDFLKPEFTRVKFLADVPFDAESSEGEIERTILAIYAGHGFAAAKVHAVRYGYPILDEGSIRVPYKVTVEEGHAYRLGTVTMAHNIPIDPVEIDRLMASRSSYMPEITFIKSLVSQVEMHLKGQGYSNCRVSLVPKLDESAGVANYTVAVDLGPNERMGQMKTAQRQ